MRHSSSTVLLAVLVSHAMLDFSAAFVVQNPSSAKAMGSALSGLMDAFKNDESLGKPKDPGLSKGPNYNENVFVNGKAVRGSVVGQKLTVVAGRARVKIPVNCK